MDIAEIEAEIRHLEAQDTSMQNCTRLAILYSIQDHFKPQNLSSYSGSKFIQLCKNAPYEKVLEIMDELISCIEIAYPKEYDKIMEQIKKAGYY